jgi:hypothetical protein
VAHVRSARRCHRHRCLCRKRRRAIKSALGDRRHSFGNKFENQIKITRGMHFLQEQSQYSDVTSMAVHRRARSAALSVSTSLLKMTCLQVVDCVWLCVQLGETLGNCPGHCLGAQLHQFKLCYGGMQDRKNATIGGTAISCGDL